MVSALEARGLAENTLVIFTSDNGAYPGMVQRERNNPSHEPSGYLVDQHGQARKIRGGKFTAWEGGHRVPFIAHWPAAIKAGVVTNDLANLQDLYRTAASLAGAELASHEGVDSIDLTKVLESDGSPQNVRTDSFSTSNAAAFSMTVRDKDGLDWKLIYAPGAGTQQKTAVDPRQEDIEPHLKSMQLFNLSESLDETDNLLADGIDDAERAKAVEIHGRLRGYLESGRSAGRQASLFAPISAIFLPASW